MSSLSRGSLQFSSQVLGPTWWPAAQGPPSPSECEPLHKLPHLLSSVCPWGPESKFWRTEINTHLRLPTMSIRLMISIHLQWKFFIQRSTYIQDYPLSAYIYSTQRDQHTTHLPPNSCAQVLNAQSVLRPHRSTILAHPRRSPVIDLS